MAINAAAHAELSRLRRDIAGIEGRLADAERLTLDPRRERRREFVCAVVGSTGARGTGAAAARRPALDAAMGGGLPLAALHEIRAGESRDGGAAGGFALALSARLAAAGAPPSL